jgi:excisionase family DNA binding protein
MHHANSILNTYLPNGAEASLALKASRKLSHAVAMASDKVALRVVSAQNADEVVEIPSAAYRFFLEILVRMAEGMPVRLMPLHAELTTQEAADLINVSRPFLVGLLEKGDIPFRRVGTHRRVLVKDLLAYKAAEDDRRKESLKELAGYQEDLGMED